MREMLRSVAQRHRVDRQAVSGPVVLEAYDWMDDGSRIELKVSIDPLKGDAEFDFTGTTPEV